MFSHKLCSVLLKSVPSRHNFQKANNIFTSSCLQKYKSKTNRGCEGCPPRKMTFEGKNALVIGGNSGIGFEIAHNLISANCKHVVIGGRDADKCLEATKILNKCHGKDKAFPVCFDVTSPREYEEALMYTVDKVCNLNILVNCYGKLDGQNWEEEICLNAISMIRGTLLGYDFMGTDSVGFGGVIINVAGTMGLEPMSGAPTFAAAKHAVVGFSRSYGTETTSLETQVRLVTLCPGITCTHMWENLENKTMTHCECELERNLNLAKKQKARVCGQSIVHLATYADTGTVWVVEGSQLFELIFPERKCYSQLRKTYLM